MRAAKATKIVPQEIIENTRGSALIYLIGVILLMSVLGSAMLNLSTTSMMGQISANHTERAYFMAEAGLNYALLLVNEGLLDGDNLDKAFTLDEEADQDGQFIITVDSDKEAAQTVITVKGFIGAEVSPLAQVDLALVITPSLVDRTIFSGGKLELKKNVAISGDIGTNGSMIKKDSGTTITGIEETNPVQWYSN